MPHGILFFTTSLRAAVLQGTDYNAGCRKYKDHLRGKVSPPSETQNIHAVLMMFQRSITEGEVLKQRHQTTDTHLQTKHTSLTVETTDKTR